MSCVMTTSPSMPITSVTWVMRREPSRRRAACTIMSTDPHTISRMVRPRLEPDHMRLLQLKLGRVLAGDDALVVVDELCETVEQRGLAGAGATRHDGVHATAPDDLEDIGAFFGDTAEIHQLGECEL